MTTTEDQQGRLVRYFYRNIELAAYKLTYAETELKLNVMKTQLLDDVGPEKSIEYWCKYWAEWQKDVVEKWHANFESTTGLTPLEIKVLQVAAKVNMMLGDSFTKKKLINSPLLRFLEEKENDRLHLQRYYESLGFVENTLVLETDDKPADAIERLNESVDVDPNGHEIVSDGNFITVSKYTGEFAFVEWRV